MAVHPPRSPALPSSGALAQNQQISSGMSGTGQALVCLDAHMNYSSAPVNEWVCNKPCCSKSGGLLGFELVGQPNAEEVWWALAALTGEILNSLLLCIDMWACVLGYEKIADRNISSLELKALYFSFRKTSLMQYKKSKPGHHLMGVTKKDRIIMQPTENNQSKWYILFWWVKTPYLCVSECSVCGILH